MQLGDSLKHRGDVGKKLVSLIWQLLKLPASHNYGSLVLNHVEEQKKATLPIWSSGSLPASGNLEKRNFVKLNPGRKAIWPHRLRDYCAVGL